MFCRLAIVLCIASLALGTSACREPVLLPDRPRYRERQRQQLQLRGRDRQWKGRGGRATAGSSLPVTGDPAIWSGGTATDLLSSVSGATAGTFLGLDGAGDGAGRATIGGKYSAFYLPAGSSSATVLPVLNSSSPYGAAYGVSNNGVIAGFSTSSDSYGNYHACVWTTSGSITDVGGLVSNSGSYVYGVSTNGTYLTGYGYPTSGSDSGQGGYVPTVWTNTGSGWTYGLMRIQIPRVIMGDAPGRLKPMPSTTTGTPSAPV